MWLWWFWLICDLLIPFVMIVAGRMSWKHCPKNINSLIGYRTTRSMKSMDTWKFAKDYCGRLWWKIGWVMIIPSALIHIPLYHSDKNTIGFAGVILVTIQCFIMIVSIYPTEKALKKHFNDDGIRRQLQFDEKVIYMKKSISRIIGVIMLIIAIVFIMFALNHPEMSFPWNNTITWLMYGVYFLVTVVLLIAPKMKK